MLSGLGFYILFIFKLFLIGILSLIVNYLYKNNIKDSYDLKNYTMISLISVSLIAIADHYSSQNQVLMLPFIILSLFIILTTLFFNQKVSGRSFMQYFLLISVSVFVGLGYYVSSISLIVVFFVIDYFLDGVFDFFINEDKDVEEFVEDGIADIEDVDVELIDEE